MARLLYTLAGVALLPWAVLHLLWRARRQPAYLKHWGERFGFFAAVLPLVPDVGSMVAPPHGIPWTQRLAPVPLRITIWIHAVSVGETRAAQPIVAALRTRYPRHRIVFTHMTPTGRETSTALFGDEVERMYLPYDMPWAVKRFLKHLRPEFGLIMETELWPNLIAASRENGVPLYLVNARLSARSARRYGRFPGLTREALQSLAGICAQTRDDAMRLQALGAGEVTITGNVKFDIAVPAAQIALGEELRRRCGERPVWLAASTREGEEALILEAWKRIVGAAMTARAGTSGGTAARALLVIVPRHPQRFDEVAKLVRGRGFTMQRRSENAVVLPDTQILLGDSMGEMFAWYAAVDLAFVGGSLLDHGSQNLIEPCAMGTPVLIGPSTYNFAEAAREAIACGAARSVRDADELVVTVSTLLADTAMQAAMGNAGREFANRHRGATARTLALIERNSPAPSPSSGALLQQ